MARFLVTGGAGFIGSHIAEKILKQGDKVRIIDNFYTGKKEHLQNMKGRAELVVGDIRNAAAVRRAMKGVDYVLHQAAFRSVPKSMEEPVLCNSINMDGIIVCLTEAHRAKVKKFVFASSSSVYGDSTTFPQRESDEKSPLSPYAATKLSGEHYLNVFALSYGMPTVSLRYFNVFGPRQDPRSKYAAVIPKFIISALAGQTIDVHWDGKQSRDFSYIDDVVQANLLAARSSFKDHRAYNVAGGKNHSLLDILHLIEKIIGRKLRVKFWPKRDGDVRKTYADIGRIRRELKYKPVLSFDKALQETFDYFAEKGRWKEYL